MLDPTLIRPDMTPAEVLAAMLPVVREAFPTPNAVGPYWEYQWRDSFRHGFTFSLGPEATWAIVFASHVLPPLMAWLVDPINTDATDFDRALTAFRDAWCAAANASRETR